MYIFTKITDSYSKIAYKWKVAETAVEWLKLLGAKAPIYRWCWLWLWHLSTDPAEQAYAVASNWGLEEDGLEYVTGFVHLDRAATSHYSMCWEKPPFRCEEIKRGIKFVPMPSRFWFLIEIGAVSDCNAAPEVLD